MTAKGTEFGGARQRPAAQIAAYVLLTVLLLLDVAFILAHLWLVGGREVFDNVWSVEADAGHAEKLQYAKWLAAALLLFALALTRRRAVYLAWAAVFLYFLVDDATTLHERAGAWLAEELRFERIQQAYLAWFPSFYLRPRDFGELAIALAVATAIAAMLLLSWPRSDAARDRMVTTRLILWLALFAFFAVGIDMVHIMAMDREIVFTPGFYTLGLIEDGGEMICASFLVGGLALELARRKGRPIFGLRRPKAGLQLLDDSTDARPHG